MSSSRFVAWLSKPASLHLIFGLYLLPRLAVLFIPLQPVSDAAWYFDRAVGLAAGEGYMEAGIPTAFWPPGWPITLSLVFRFFGASVLHGQVFNLVCALITAWLVLDLGRRLFGSVEAGRLALLLLALYPNSIGYVPQLLTEVFYTTLLLLGCWLLIAVRGWAGLAMAGLVFGVSTLVKAQSLLVVILIFGTVLLREPVSVRRIVQTAGRAALVLAVALLVVFPWSYRNHQLFGEWVMVSTNGGATLLTGNNPSARGDYTDSDPLVTSLHRTVANQLETDKEARRRAMVWIQENPGRFVALMPLKAFRLWAPDGEAEWGFQSGYAQYEPYAPWFRTVRYLNQAYYVGLMLGFAVAAFRLFSARSLPSSRRFDWWLLPYGIFLYPTAIAVVFSGQSRFHYPIMPFIAMTCGWLAFDLVTRASKRQPQARLRQA